MQMNTPAAFEPGIALPGTLSPSTQVYVWRDDKILVRATEPPAMPTLAEVERAGIDGTRLYLGRLEGIDCIALHAASDAAEPEGWQWRGLRSLFLQIPEAHLALAGRAFQIVQWHRNHRFCGRCATPTRDKSTERSKECPACGLVVYPRISPAMMVTLFLGGWSLPWFGLDQPAAPDQIGGGLLHIGIFLGKTVILVLVVMWVRWMWPRFRYDQLMNLGWRRFVPLALVNIVVTAAVLWMRAN